MKPHAIVRLALLLPGLLSGQTPADRPPIIDMHLHAYAPGGALGGPREASLAPTAAEGFLDAVLLELRRHNVVLALTSGAERDVAWWHDAAPGVIVGGALFPCPGGVISAKRTPCSESGTAWPDSALLRAKHRDGRLGFLGEVLGVYAGIAPADPRFDAYYALARELDIPVAIHTGAGPERRGPECHCPDWNGALGNPALLRPILQRYAGLRVLLMHAGGPGFLDETIALMREYPTVYVDLAAIILAWPAERLHAWIGAIVDAGFGDRLLFGSDSVFSLSPSLAVLNAIPFLSPMQRRAILYDNAARFLRLPPEVIARHHQSGGPQ